MRKGPGASGAASPAHFWGNWGGERAPAGVASAHRLGAPSWTSLSCVCSVREADGNHGPEPGTGLAIHSHAWERL